MWADEEGAMQWDDPQLRVGSDSSWVAQQRQQQSWWRQTILQAQAGPAGRRAAVGSSLKPEDVRDQPWLNFLNCAAYRHALHRTAEVRATAGTLDRDRLFRNLLSSMPLAFNVFGALREEDAFVELVQRTWAPEASEILGVQCEWSPRPKADYLDDNTAFDAAIWFVDDKGRRCLLGIEVKYTEAFSPKPYFTNRYRRMTRDSGWFRRGASERLKASATNQMWRNTMLAASVELQGDVDRALVGTLSLDGDRGVQRAVDGLTAELTDDSRLRPVTLSDLVHQAESVPELASWAAAFAARYLEDPLGPVSAAPVTPPAPPLRVLPCPRRRTADDHNGGHVFVTAGDLNRLSCDAVLVPTDHRRHVTASFEPLVRPHEGALADLRWGADRLVARLNDPLDHGPEVWIGDVATAAHAGTIDDLARDFVELAGTSAWYRHGRRPRLALPVIGTGDGGSASSSGAVSQGLLICLRDAASAHNVDIVLITQGRAAYSAAQRVRHQSLGDHPLDDDFDLGEPGRDQQLTDIANQLAQIARSGELVLFLGAGVSVGAGLPGWQHLIDGLAQQLPDEVRPQLARLHHLDLRDQAAVLARRFQAAGLDFDQQLRRQLHSEHHGLTHELLASVPSTEAVTTNYDQLFEQAVAATSDQLAVLPGQPAVGSDRWLLKLHGDLTETSDLVLTREDYLRLPTANGALLGIVQAMLMTRHMLFVGYSLSDEDFHQLVDEVRLARSPTQTDDEPFGTVLVLFDDPLFEDLWSGDLRIVAMAEEPTDPTGPSPSELATAARRLQIFIDLLGLLAADHRAFILDDRYRSILTDDEAALRNALLAAFKHRPAAGGPLWSALDALVGRMGGTV
jgi:hypothetical protein